MSGIQGKANFSDQPLCVLSKRILDRSFQRDIELLSLQSSRNHVYPRPDLTTLDSYMKSSVTHRLTAASSNNASAVPEEDLTAFAIIHDLATGADTRFRPSPNDLANFVAHDALTKASLLFLRGYSSPEWLNAVGEKYGVSPDLYQRHLLFKAFTSGRRDMYSSPALPSASTRVFQLTIPTICARNIGGYGYEPEDLQQPRRLGSEAMGRYFQQLRTRAKVADSVVRECLLLSKQEYFLEQTVSIEVGPPGENWRAVVWSIAERIYPIASTAPGCHVLVPEPGRHTIFR